MTWTTQFRDACSLYAAPDVLKRYTSGSIGGMIASPDNGTALTAPLDLRRSGIPASAGFLCGIKFRVSVLNGNLITFTNSDGDQCQFGTNPSGYMTIHRDSLNIIAQNTTLPISINTWYTVWFGYLLSDTVGRIQVVRDGTTIGDLTSTALGGTVSDSLDTKPATATQFNGLILCRAPQLLCDIDWVILRSDTAGTVWSASDIFGNLFKRTLRGKSGTAGDGFYRSTTGWGIGAGSGSHSDNIRETTFDSDTTHLVRATVSGTDADRDSFKCDPMPSNTGLVKHVAHVWVSRRSPNGSTVRHKGGIYTPGVSPFLHEDATEQTDTDGYTVRETGYDVHPGDSGAWTKARVDEVQPAIRATAIS